MKRAVSVAVLTVAGVIPLWRYDASSDTSSNTVLAEPAAPVQGPQDPAVGSVPPPGSGGTESGTTPPTSGAVLGGAAPPATRVVAGPTVNTKHGSVQVEVTFQGNRISAVRMLKQPDSGPTKNAVPKLIASTLKAQSADVDSVSGATTTSGAYKNSLQAAIDQKGG